MASTADFRNGLVLEIDDQLYQLVYFQHVKPGKGGAFVRTKLKNIRTGAVIDRTYNAGERVRKFGWSGGPMQFSYGDGHFYHFMDQQTYDDIMLTDELIGPDQLKYLKEGMECEGLVHDDRVITVELPSFVELTVTQTAPGSPGRHRHRRDQAGHPGDRGNGAGSALHRGGSGDSGRPPRRQVPDPRMSPQEMQQLAELLQNVPGIRSIDLKDVKRLAQLLREAPEIGSIEVKGWFGTGVVITRTSAAPVAPRHGCRCRPHCRRCRLPRSTEHRRSRCRARAAARPSERDPVADGRHVLQGPRTRRRGLHQGGQPGHPGQTVCIIEAMKIMNEIEAEIAGVVREISVEDSQPVEFGQVLFRVDPEWLRPKPPRHPRPTFNFKKTIAQMVQRNASDLLLKVGRPPTIRLNGELQGLEMPRSSRRT